MGRAPRIESEGLWYHVYNRGNEKRDVFLSDKDYRLFLDMLFQSCTQFDAEVHAYAVMTNHFHVMLRTRRANLCRLMHYTLSAFTRRYNALHERVGHVFQGRYKAIVVDSEAYGRELLRYIHLNPARVSGTGELNMRERLRMAARYEWSSHQAYAGTARCSWPLVTADLLQSFGKTAAEQRHMYAQYVTDGLRGTTDIFDHVLGKAILGSQTFVARIKEIVRAEHHDDTAACERRRISACGLDDVIRAVSEVYRVSDTELVQRYPEQRCREARRVLLWAAARYCSGGMPLAAMGRRLGGISIAALTHARDRVEAAAMRSRELTARMRAVTRRVTSSHIHELPMHIHPVWRAMYQRLAEFHRRHGHSNVPRAYQEDPVLASWVARQRRLRAHPELNSQPLSAEQIVFLDKLRFRW